MLTGRPPFADADQPGTDSDFLVKQAHVQREPTDIRQLRPDVPAALADAISRALAKDQDQRPARCALLAGMLGHPAALAAPGPAPTSSIAAGQRSGTSSTVAAGPLQSSSGAGHGDATAAELACPICGAHGTEMHGAKKLYDVPVCKRCRNAFANRRQGAFLLDSIGVFVVGVILLLALSGDEAGPSNTALVVCALVVNGLLVCKDGLGGRSLGKLLTGVGVIDVSTGAAGGTWASILRNSPLLVVHARNSGE
jgi:hypothetical protein